jgi:type IV pilus assembly protein PilM
VIGDVTEDGQKKMQMVLVAAKRDLINEKLEIIKAAGLSPLVIDVDAFALETVFERLPPPEGGEAFVALNIGNKVTNLAIIEGGMTRVARDVLIAGSAISRTISKSLAMELATAEELKRRVGLQTPPQPPVPQEPAAQGKPAAVPTQEEMASTIASDIVRDLAVEVHRSLDFYLSQAKDRAVSALYITGGSAGMKNLAPFLASELKINVEVVTPLSFMNVAGSEPVPPELAPSLTVAAGLALRKLWDWE